MTRFGYDDEWQYFVSRHEALGEAVTAAHKATLGLLQLAQALDRVGDSLQYVYDFGDDWCHHILLEAILLAEAGTFYPRCVGGARNGPPEDSGGPAGYAEYLQVLADPDHDEHENTLAWRGAFNPEAFSLPAVNAALTRAFYRRPPSRRAAAGGSASAE